MKLRWHFKGYTENERYKGETEDMGRAKKHGMSQSSA